MITEMDMDLELENSMDTGIKEIGLLLEQEETEAA